MERVHAVHAMLEEQVRDARARTLALVDGLEAEQLLGPRLPIVNPLRWEIGHAAYFHEYWVLRRFLGMPAMRPDVDDLFDSILIPHDTRWDLPLPSLAETLEYMRRVLEAECAALRERGADSEQDYLVQYAVFHEDMHTEAFLYSRQTLGYPAPGFGQRPECSDSEWVPERSAVGDVAIPGGEFWLGARPEDGFCFDNEKWAHRVPVKPFRISRMAVSHAEFLAFVEDGGYRDQAFWDVDGWAWRSAAGAQWPVYWRPGADGWERRWFNVWEPLPMRSAMIHVNWFEARAWCRWAGRRLPTELEWEVAAAGEPTPEGDRLSPCKRYYPWGETAPTPAEANLDGRLLGTLPVDALPAGDSAFGCRQMLGNAWEWTDSVFAPYPGFVPDMYADYSQPLFGNTRVLRGGAWATRARLIRATWRNYYGPERNDVLAGFRTCAS
jgi:iron(II)-dependent oxidoreductase